MAYEPKTWVCGETITAEALNHMEQGIANAGGGGTAVYEMTVDSSTRCVTIHASFNDLVASNGGLVRMEYGGVVSYQSITVFSQNSDSSYSLCLGVSTTAYTASSADEEFTMCSPTPDPN